MVAPDVSVQEPHIGTDPFLRHVGQEFRARVFEIIKARRAEEAAKIPPADIHLGRDLGRVRNQVARVWIIDVWIIIVVRPTPHLGHLLLERQREGQRVVRRFADILCFAVRRAPGCTVADGGIQAAAPFAVTKFNGLYAAGNQAGHGHRQRRCEDIMFQRHVLDTHFHVQSPLLVAVLGSAGFELVPRIRSFARLLALVAFRWFTDHQLIDRHHGHHGGGVGHVDQLAS